MAKQQPPVQPEQAQNTTVVLSLYQKIAALKQELVPLEKDKENPYHKSVYFDINSILEQIEPLMIKYNLLLTQPIINGFVVSRIMCLDSGEVDESSLQLPVTPDPQKIGSCITYFRRYTVVAQIGLQAEDDDGNKGGGKTPAKDDLTDSERYNQMIGTHERAIAAIRTIPALTPYYNNLSNELKTDPEIMNLIKNRRTALTPKTA